MPTEADRFAARAERRLAESQLLRAGLDVLLDRASAEAERLRRLRWQTSHLRPERPGSRHYAESQEEHWFEF